MPKKSSDLCYCVQDSTVIDSYILLVSNLRKSYLKVPAVKGLNFGVKASECFGLLGINGAGKTTTFKMLVGEIFPTTGTANILGYSLLKDKPMYLKQIGYCPQFDALNLQLTTRELLTLFANLRGIPQNKTKEHVNQWLNKLDLIKYHNMEAGKLSAGNKRKLSSAIALIGDPPVIMLDEPTTGMDPIAKTTFWRLLDEKRRTGKAIVLTSPSMAECEALCDRLAIMVDGQLKCIGSIQYLKRKFAHGFMLMVKLKYIPTVESTSGDDNPFEKKVANLKSAIQREFECKLKDEHKGMVMYHITQKDVTLGILFEFMEHLKRNKEIVEDFTVNDTNLEQIFISFAKERNAGKDKDTMND